MNTKYTISLSPKNRRHRIIDSYIKNNTDQDGRGVRVQPFVEQILYECAASELPLMDILWVIRKAGKGGDGIDPLKSEEDDVPPAINRGEVRDLAESRRVDVAPSRPVVGGPPEIADMGGEAPPMQTVDGRSSMAKSLAEFVVSASDDPQKAP